MFLAMFYDPSPTQAYASVTHLTNDVFLGEFVRGMHKWGASVMIILICLHMARTFVFGAYKYPRELNWVIGVVLLILTMVMGFTGYLLPFDQRSFWATVVGVNINGTGPFIGPYLGDFLRGGAEFNGTTLSRFYAIHMLHRARPDHRPDRGAPVPGREARDHRAAVAAAEARPRRLSRRSGYEPRREGGLPPRLRAAEEGGQALLPLRGDEGLDDGADRRAGDRPAVARARRRAGAEGGPDDHHLHAATRVVLLLPVRGPAGDQAARTWSRWRRSASRRSAWSCCSCCRSTTAARSAGPSAGRSR